MPKIDRAHKNSLTPEICEETHLREIFYGTLIFQQSRWDLYWTPRRAYYSGLRSPDDQTQPFEMTPGFKPFTVSLLFCLRCDPLIVFRRQNHRTLNFRKTMSHGLLLQMANSIICCTCFIMTKKT